MAGDQVVGAIGVSGASADQDEVCAMAGADKIKARLKYVSAGDKPLGEFAGHVDIGAPKLAGDATYDATSQQYTLTASGANMFGAHDEFHFVWRRLRGDFTLQARVEFVGTGVEAHRKAGLMARSSLDAGAAYVDGVIHGNGPTALQVRRTDGANTDMMVTAAPTDALTKLLGTATPGVDFLQLERRGNTYIFSATKYGQPFTQREIADLNLGDEIYIGLFLCAHNADATERALFHEVHVTGPAVSLKRAAITAR
jgi:hypothetical protein